MIKAEDLGRCMDYGAYKELLERLLKEGRTTGHEQGEEKIANAKVNFQRMLRVERDIMLNDELSTALEAVKGKYTWVVITEGWCADTAQQMPVFAEVSAKFPAVSLCLLLRDDNPQVMDQYLTNGTRSIPKLISIERDTLKEVFVWGPRPVELQDMILKLKKENASKEQKGLLLQKWYNTDKTQSLQLELARLVRQHMA
jgi:hypothetical protein